MKIRISKEGSGFVVDPYAKSGSPSVGRGATMNDALATFLIAYQEELGLDIEVHESAKPAEMRRRRREVNKR
jgi:hypothetical protein